MMKRDDHANSRLAILLGLLEPLLLNDQCLELVLQPALGMMEIFLDILRLPNHLRRKNVEVEGE
jgi:hypothetical protein